jgi:hypothetical protein
MIISPFFAWGHVPKAAGDHTLAMFQFFPDLIEHADPFDSNDKHALFTDRLERVAGKQLVLNIRRLPAWTLSYAHHRNRWGEYPDYAPQSMMSPYIMASQPLADGILKDFTDKGSLAIDQWLRTECLTQDFLEFISRFTEVSDRQRDAVGRLGRRNVHDYDRVVAHWFTSDHIAMMYRANPLWATVERRAYGDTFVDRLPLW